MLVALERNRVVGFAITSPATDPDCDPVADAELMELTVDPDERGRGHGSRLLQAAVDTMVADRFSRAVCWAVASDDALRRFLTEAGWAPDGAHRELDLDGTGATTVKQVRLHTSHWSDVSGWVDFRGAARHHGSLTRQGLAMGPLPQLHRYSDRCVSCCSSAWASGVWLAGYYDLPLGGVGVGLGVGCLLAYLLVHDFRRPRSVRVTRRR